MTHHVSTFLIKPEDIQDLPQAIHSYALEGYIQEMVMVNMQSEWLEEEQRWKYSFLYRGLSDTISVER